MGKSRVYEIAKELNVDSKVVIDQLATLNVTVKNHMSTIPADVVEQVKVAYKTSMTTTQQQVKQDNHSDKGTKEIPLEQVKQQKGVNTKHMIENQKSIEKTAVKPAEKPIEKQAEQQAEKPTGKPPYPKNQNGTSTNRNNERPKTSGNRENGARPATTGGAKPTNTHQKPTNNRPGSNPAHKPAGENKSGDGNKSDHNRVNNKPTGNTRPNTAGGNSNTAHKPGQNNQPKPKTSERPTTATTAEGEYGFKEKGNTKPEPVSRPKRSDSGGYNNRNSNNNNRNRNYRGKGKRRNPDIPPKEFAEVKHTVVIEEETISVQMLAHQLGKKATDVIMKLMSLGVMATINQELDVETATIMAEEFGASIEIKATKEEELLVDVEDQPQDMKPRPPVVTIMGHVDHGKTSLLDKIRAANVTSTEAGGITQHIGAYQVEAKGQKITFLDTPGHEAFTAMRARGAQVTDIAILVVAADDGVMPQTIEAIDHAKAAEVPIIIAINKIDKPEANIDRIKQELSNHGLISEEWGGETIMVPVSAKSGIGISDLLEMILLVAEVGELKANPARNGRGKVVESKLDKGRGPVATLLVQNGTLHVGDFLIVGATQGRIRAMFDYRGRALKSAPPSMPVEVLGLSEVPQAGDDFIAVENEKLAKQVAEKRQKDKHQQEIARNMKVSLEDIFAQIQDGEVKELNIVLKADVQGSIEAIKQSLEKVGTDEVRVNIIHTGVGGIRETDVNLAAASNAIIIGFNVRPDVNAKKLAEKEDVDINTYRIIYEAIEDVKAALSGLLAPEIKEVELGQAEVRSVFKVPKVGMVAGCYVLEGKIVRNAKVRVVRDSVVIYDGELSSLRRFKDDVKEVAAGYECGMDLERFNDIKEGDIFEAYTFEEIKREL